MIDNKEIFLVRIACTIVLLISILLITIDFHPFFFMLIFCFCVYGMFHAENLVHYFKRFKKS